jgi:hypothetical protein
MNRKISKRGSILIPILALSSALGSGCGGEKMPKYSILQSLRVIGLLTNPPEVDFDGVSTFTPSTFTLTPVISDLYGGTRSLRYNLYHCIDPGVGLGAIPSCTGNPTRFDVEVARDVLPPYDTFEPNVNRTGALLPIPITLDLGTLGSSLMALY